MPTSDAIRQTLYSAYMAVRSKAVTDSISAVTLDHLLQERINSIDSSNYSSAAVGNQGTQIVKVSELGTLQKMEDDFNSVISSIESAGSDPAKLTALGLYGSDTATNSVA